MGDAAVAAPSRPVLAGNGLAAVRVLDLLLENWAAPDVLVLAPPDESTHSWQPSLAEAAVARNVAVLAPEDVNDEDVVATLASNRTDLLLSVYYTQVFRPHLLASIDGPALNFHPSLLPRHRGTAPIIWALAEGDTMTGVSVHELTQGVDTGRLLWQQKLPIHRNDTGYSLHMKAANLVTAIAADLLRRLAAGRELPTAVEQTGSASVHRLADPRLNQIAWTDPPTRIRNIVRALASPLPGAYTSFSGKRIGIERVELAAVATAPRAPGMVQIGNNDDILVWTPDGPLTVVDVMLDGEPHPAEALMAIGVREGDVFA